jgi:hypothetical protein
VTVSISVIVLDGIALIYLVRNRSTTIWSAFVAALFGFLLAFTAVGPSIHTVIDNTTTGTSNAVNKTGYH